MQQDNGKKGNLVYPSLILKILSQSIPDKPCNAFQLVQLIPAPDPMRELADTFQPGLAEGIGEQSWQQQLECLLAETGLGCLGGRALLLLLAYQAG